MFFTHPSLKKYIPSDILKKYEIDSQNKSFEIFHDKCYRTLNYVPGGDTHEDQVIKLLILKYFFIE